MVLAVLSSDEARAVLLNGIRTVHRCDFRRWLEKRENFRRRRFVMPKMGVCMVDESGLTCAGGLGLFVFGLVEDGVAIYPAWGHHGFDDCSLCGGKQCNEFSMGSGNNTHTFCFRCVVERTGDESHVLENLLYLANHIIRDRSNATWSGSTHCQTNGCVPLVSVKQPSACHPEFFIRYNSKPMTSTLRTDQKICVGHLGRPAVQPKAVAHPFWHLCAKCYQRLKRKAKNTCGVCPVCEDAQAGESAPMCPACRKRYHAFVWKRKPVVE